MNTYIHVSPASQIHQFFSTYAIQIYIHTYIHTYIQVSPSSQKHQFFSTYAIHEGFCFSYNYSMAGNFRYQRVAGSESDYYLRILPRNWRAF